MAQRYLRGRGKSIPAFRSDQKHLPCENQPDDHLRGVAIAAGYLGRASPLMTRHPPGRFPRVAQSRLQRLSAAPVVRISLAGLCLVLAGCFAVGSVVWLGVTLIAVGFWPAMLGPIAVHSYVRTASRPSAKRSIPPAATPHEFVDSAESTNSGIVPTAQPRNGSARSSTRMYCRSVDHQHCSTRSDLGSVGMRDPARPGRPAVCSCSRASDP